MSSDFHIVLFRILGVSAFALLLKMGIGEITFEVAGTLFNISITKLYYSGEGFLEAYRLDYGPYLIFFTFLELATNKNLSVTPDETVQNSEEIMFIKSGNEMISLHVKEIKFIEGLKDYIKIQTDKGPVIVKKTMKGILSQLPENHFLRVHKSFIVNLSFVDRRSEIQRESQKSSCK